MEETLHSLTEQLTALNTRRQEPPRCFTCCKQGHIARNCRIRRMQQTSFTCFKCGNKGHIARDCKNQGNGTGGTQSQRAGCAPPTMVDTRTTHNVPTIKAKQQRLHT